MMEFEEALGGCGHGRLCRGARVGLESAQQDRTHVLNFYSEMDLAYKIANLL